MQIVMVAVSERGQYLPMQRRHMLSIRSIRAAGPWS